MTTEAPWCFKCKTTLDKSEPVWIYDRRIYCSPPCWWSDRCLNCSVDLKEQELLYCEDCKHLNPNP